MSRAKPKSVRSVPPFRPTGFTVGGQIVLKCSVCDTRLPKLAWEAIDKKRTKIWIGNNCFQKAAAASQIAIPPKLLIRTRNWLSKSVDDHKLFQVVWRAECPLHVRTVTRRRNTWKCAIDDAMASSDPYDVLRVKFLLESAIERYQSETTPSSELEPSVTSVRVDVAELRSPLRRRVQDYGTSKMPRTSLKGGL